MKISTGQLSNQEFEIACYIIW